MNIIYADENAARRELFATFMNKRGHHVTVASCVADAIAILDSTSEVNMVVSLLAMNGAMGGLEVLKSANDLKQGISLCLLCTINNRGAVVEAEGMGAVVTYIPIGMRDLCEVLGA